MATALEVTKRNLFTDYNNRYNNDVLPPEDCKFLTFTEFLDEADIFKNPTPSRKSDIFKNGKWSILGYSTDSYIEIQENDDQDNDDQDDDLEKSSFKIKWEYTIFNGVFSSGVEIKTLSKLDVEKFITETKRFLEKTFSNSLINDFCEAQDLQKNILLQYKLNNLDRVVICVVTDEVIDHERFSFPSKIKLENADIECIIKYWDLQRWNDLKRSKIKRETINVDFYSKDFSHYKIPYLKKDTNNNITYYLSIFPGDLIADLYELNNTGLLENNVRVFLSSTKRANKAIRETIGGDNGKDAHKFFSYNNGISATAESIEIDDNYITKIKDFQIVNGGQTTATLHYSRKKDKSSLKEVYVAVKISELKKNDEYYKIVSNISQAANTQSTVSSSDFYANDKMLVEIERLSLKNPIQNEEGKNIFYFFERMKGQYNVSKLGLTTTKQQKTWENSHPFNLVFNKIDVARTYNIINELPHVASTGAEKQFKDFMENKYFKRAEINFNSYKKLIGVNLLFKRIKKLCGTSNGVTYPSLTIDPITKKHAPVAMSTAIYATTLVHLITKGRIDYWGIYYNKYNLCKSIYENPKNKNERINSDLDYILEKIIVECWLLIAEYGGAAAQEKTKSNLCWNFVKSNFKLSNDLLEELNKFCIRKEELVKRESEIDLNEDSGYFFKLNELLEGNGNKLYQLLNITNTYSEFKIERQTISNFIKKIANNSLLPIKKVEEIHNFLIKMKNEGFSFETNKSNLLEYDMNFVDIYNSIFKEKNTFIKKMYNDCYNEEVISKEKESTYNETIEIIDKFYREYGLSISELKRLNDIIKLTF